MINEIRIGNRTIGSGNPPFIIAEMSGNHNHSLERALALIDAAADSGAHAIKIQTYTAKTMTLDLSEGPFFISDPKSLWKGRSLYSLYEEAHTPWDWHAEIFKRCKERKIICFSTPFDTSAVDFLEKFDPPCYKIASFENCDLPLLKRVAQTKRPVIISSGMATIAELDDAIQTLRSNGCDKIILLKCTSSYPADPSESNILTIPHMRDLFSVQVGLSDHTLGIGVSVASVALGATVIEKHFTLRRADGGVDSVFSMEPNEMRALVEETERAFLGLGKISYGVSANEKKSMIFRRSLFITQDIKAGERLNANNLRCIRPGNGLSPKYYETLLGKKVTRDLKRGTPVDWTIFE